MNNITHTYKLSYADYYPFGMKMPGKFGGGSYRYAYQGQEKDTETGFEAFELRQWDGRIGRWMSTDPYGQHASPYLGMGNNPISMVDPNGGYSWIGAWIRNGFSREGLSQSTMNGEWGYLDGEVLNGHFEHGKYGNTDMMLDMTFNYSDGLSVGIDNLFNASTFSSSSDVIGNGGIVLGTFLTSYEKAIIGRSNLLPPVVYENSLLFNSYGKMNFVNNGIGILSVFTPSLNYILQNGSEYSKADLVFDTLFGTIGYKGGSIGLGISAYYFLAVKPTIIESRKMTIQHRAEWMHQITHGL